MGEIEIQEMGLTRQREVVLRVIRDSREHLTASEVFSEAKVMLPSISFATVYNSLRFLKEAGHIAEIQFGNGASRFDRMTSRHDHAICTKCGTLVDIVMEQCALTEVQKRIVGQLSKGYKQRVGLADALVHEPDLIILDEFQRFKHHPVIKQVLTGGQRLSYGARAITKGGLQSQPKMHFPGGLLLGDNAGTLNFAKIKGTHTAMKSGMIAAEVVTRAIAENRELDDLAEFGQSYRTSWAWNELHVQRNFGPAIHKWGPFLGGAYAFLDINLCNGKLPWTLSDPIADHARLRRAADCKPIQYPKPDSIISFDRLSSVYLSNTNHEEDQPCHLKLASPDLPIAKNLPEFAEPAQRYCPAGVYEVLVGEDGSPKFQINAQNCVHCKTCDIKDPLQNITWVAPEGGGGPNYPNM